MKNKHIRLRNREPTAAYIDARRRIYRFNTQPIYALHLGYIDATHRIYRCYTTDI